MSRTGTFIWHELLTTDDKAAKAFYQRIAVWGTQAFDATYTMWTVRDRPMGGMTKLPPDADAKGMRPAWLGYVGVTDLEASCNKVRELGGQVHHREAIPGVGEIAVVADPQGAAFGLYRAERESEAFARSEPGAISWAELNSTDWEGAWKFYAALFGWQSTGTMDMGPPVGTYAMFTKGDPSLGHSMGGMSNVATAMGAPAHWLYYINVRDIDEALALTKELGGQVLNGPMDVPGEGKIAQCIDPQGVMFAVYADPGTKR